MPHGFTSDLKVQFHPPVPDTLSVVTTNESAKSDPTPDPTPSTEADGCGDLLIDLLPDEQRRAIQLLVEPRAGDNLDPGATSRRPRPTYTRIAQQVGVNRSTLYRWLTGDGAFNRALAQWQDLLAKRYRTRVLLIGDKALTVLERGMNSYNDDIALKAAELALKAKQHLDKFLPPPPPPTKEPADNGGAGS